MGSTRTASVSCVQTIWGFAKVIWIFISSCGELSIRSMMFGAELRRAQVLQRKYSTMEKSKSEKNERRDRTAITEWHFEVLICEEQFT